MTAPGPRELTIDLPGLRLAARAWGPEDGRPVLALHGWLDNAGSFDALAPLLGGVHLVALDLPGHGRSEHRPPGAAYHLTDYVLDAAAAADRLGWERYAVMGHSLGGGIGMLLAASLPAEVERLVLLDGLAPGTTEPADAPARLTAAIRERRAPPARRERVYPTLEDAMTRLAMVNPALSAPALRALVARGTRPTDGGLCFAADPRLRGTSPLRLSRAHVDAFLDGVRCPTLLVRPSAGIPLEPGQVEHWLGRLCAVRVIQVAGHHHAHLDDAPSMARKIDAFLAGRTSASDGM